MLRCIYCELRFTTRDGARSHRIRTEPHEFKTIGGWRCLTGEELKAQGWSQTPTGKWRR